MTELINDEADCSTAPATPGLLKKEFVVDHIWCQLKEKIARPSLDQQKPEIVLTPTPEIQVGKSQTKNLPKQKYVKTSYC